MLTNEHDPQHLKSFATACQDCGARWRFDDRGEEVMTHDERCAYLLSFIERLTTAG